MTTFDPYYSHISHYTTMSNKLEILLKWFDDNKIEWDKDALEIKEDNGSFGVHAKKSMKKDKPGII